MHLQIGEGLAINCGDFGLNFMPGIILGDISLPSEKKLSILREINDMARRTIEGQALDIGWAYEDNYNITIDDYTAMARCKTSYYSAATPLVCGAIAANANDTTKQVLMKFGLDVGLAFQIQDDILNLIGDNSDTGKGECDDIAEGKRTLIVIHALNNAKKDDRHRLCELLSSKKNTQSDISEALSIINSSSSIEYASDYANKLIADSVSYLCENINKNHALDIVVSMANWALTRKR